MPKVIDDIKIFEAAINILMSMGYDRATTHKIAEIAGVNEVTLFRKYGSKARLFEQAITYQLSETPLNRLVYTGDLEADMLAIVRAYAETYARYGDIIAIILLELPRNPDLNTSVSTPLQNLQGTIEILQRYQAQGELKQESTLITISALLGPIMVYGMINHATLDMDMPPIDLQSHVDAFLQGRKA